MIKLLSGRLLVTLDEGKNNIGKVTQDNLNSFLRIPRKVVETISGEEATPVAPEEYYDHIIFVKEMSDEVEIDGVTYLGMHRDAIIAVITD